MQRKEFISRLFNKKISADDYEYWYCLYAESLYRLKLLKDLNCGCTFCFREKIQCENLLDKMVTDRHIKSYPKASRLSGKGDCGQTPSTSLLIIL